MDANVGGDGTRTRTGKGGGWKREEREGKQEKREKKKTVSSHWMVVAGGWWWSLVVAGGWSVVINAGRREEKKKKKGIYHINNIHITFSPPANHIRAVLINCTAPPLHFAATLASTAARQRADQMKGRANGRENIIKKTKEKAEKQNKIKPSFFEVCVFVCSATYCDGENSSSPHP